MNINSLNTVSTEGLKIDPAAAAPQRVESNRPPSQDRDRLASGEKIDKKAEASNTTRDSIEESIEIADVLNEMMSELQTNIGFSIREDLNHQVVVEIKDRKTDELIKQIPTEEMLKIKEKMEELTGLIFDQSV